ncbi:methyltransferase domain-containing protein [uncultured Tateyamaria sp.]|uniref:class I SAM-dependent DNA methyltransferase n=1 Tax=Tateyamaria sp. 1078 TaxID=3417464 RepID=UPI002611DE22|nr:methyltransferase domain-containing protein [uncultured Tateyamaria sp.]
MSDDPSLSRAYALNTPADSVALYRDWADSYDADFAQNSDYILHEQVARHFTLIGGFGPVLDVGAGTGLCGEALAARGNTPIDGTDISPEMLEVAATKDVYRNLFAANLMDGLPVPARPYQGAVSSGTFTHGHVGPDGIDPILPALRPRAWVVISVNAQHYAAAGFEARMEALSSQIAELSLTEVPIYGPAATGAHALDRALLVAFRVGG